MKNKTALLTLVSVFLLSIMLVTSISAQERRVDFIEGDWFKYGDIAVNWNSNNPNATFPSLPFSLPFPLPDQELIEKINQTEWVLVSVEDVSGTNITFQATVHFENGAESVFGGYVNIDTGDGNMTFLAISADLGVNDTIYNSSEYSTWKIDETVVKAYPDCARETNHLNMTQELSWSCGIEFYFYFSIDLYWDKSTGILVEMSGEGNYQIGEDITFWSAFGRIIDSSSWIIPEFPTGTSMLIILLALTGVIAIYKQKLLKTPIG